jgi:hypothetical protein
MNKTMTEELKKYLLEQCREWMLPEELRALTRIGLTEQGELTARSAATADLAIENIYGFADPKTNQLVQLGSENIELEIANRLLKDAGKHIINNCPKCGKLARTPKAKQCRHCGHDWHTNS